MSALPTDHPLVQAMAATEHERWSHWQQYLHDLATRNGDGSLTIPANLVERWERQMTTPYGELSEVEQASDVHEVERIVRTIIEAGYVIVKVNGPVAFTELTGA